MIELFPHIIIIVLIVFFLFYLVKVELENNRWQLDKYDALYYYSNKFFKKQGYEICKIDLVTKTDYERKTHIIRPFLQEEQFLRKIIVMDSERSKYATIVKVKRSRLFGTSIKILKKENYIE